VSAEGATEADRPGSDTSTRRTAGLWLPVAAWMALIFWLSSQPDLPHAPDALLDFVLKKGLHAAGFGVLAGLWLRALVPACTSPRLADSRNETLAPPLQRQSGWPAGQSPPLARARAWAFAATFAYAAVDEFHQSFVPGRTARVADVLIDAAGAVVALAVLAWSIRFKAQ
jgi:VanZ family protein